MGDSQRERLEERIGRELLLALLLFGVAIVQTTLLPLIGGVQLNLLLLLVVCQGLVVGFSDATRWAFYGGLALDLCAPGLPLGSHALVLLAAALAGVVPLRRLSRNNWGIPLVGMLLGGLAAGLVTGALTRLLIGPLDPALFVRETLLPTLAVVLVPGLPLYLLLRWIEARRRGEIRIEIS